MEAFIRNLSKYVLAMPIVSNTLKNCKIKNLISPQIALVNNLLKVNVCVWMCMVQH